jgi:uncharacterized protein YehS (DUF1456 family)
VDATVLEIIELPDGEIALKRVDDDSLPLVKISFSEESEIMLDSMKMEIARVMIEAGMQAFAEMNAMKAVEEEDSALLH